MPTNAWVKRGELLMKLTPIQEKVLVYIAETPDNMAKDIGYHMWPDWSSQSEEEARRAAIQAGSYIRAYLVTRGLVLPIEDKFMGKKLRQGFKLTKLGWQEYWRIFNDKQKNKTSD